MRRLVSTTRNFTTNTSVTTDVIGNDTDVDRTNRLSIKPSSAVIRSAIHDNTNAPIALRTARVTHDGQSITFDPGTDFNELLIGETATIIVEYAVTDDDPSSPLSDAASLHVGLFGTRLHDPVPARAACELELELVTDELVRRLSAQPKSLHERLTDEALAGWDV